MQHLITYWHIGQQIILSEQNGNKRAPKGTQLLERLSAEYTQKFGREYNPTNMLYMRRFFLFFPIPDTPINQGLTEKTQYTQSGYSPLWEGLGEALTWSHYREALKTNNEYEAKFYITQAIKDNWSVRQLKQQIKNKLYYHISITAHLLEKM